MFICIPIIESKSHGKSEIQEFFNLNDELVKHLCIGKKERIIVSEAVNETHFLLLFSTFQNYEVSVCMCICYAKINKLTYALVPGKERLT